MNNYARENKNDNIILLTLIAIRALLMYFFFFFFSRAAPEVYGGSQARGLIGAVAAGLRQSHSNAGSELCMLPTPQLTATPVP